MALFLRFLRMLNIFAPFMRRRKEALLAVRRAAQWEMVQRREEREIQRQMIESLTSVVKESLAATNAQTAVVARMLDSFNVNEAPTVREWDEDAYVEKHIRKKASTSLPPALAGLDQLDQYRALVDKLDTFGLD